MKNFDDSKNWDGIIGNGTYSLLMSDDAKAYYLARGDGDDRTKVITKLVEDVTNLQNRLIQLGNLTGSARACMAAPPSGGARIPGIPRVVPHIDGIAGQGHQELIYSTEAWTHDRCRRTTIPSCNGVDHSSRASAHTSPTLPQPRPLTHNRIKRGPRGLLFSFPTLISRPLFSSSQHPAHRDPIQ
jgi:hypothetical protein